MKKIIAVLIVVGAAYVAFDYYLKHKDEITGPRTPEEERFDQLEQEFLDLRQSFDEGTSIPAHQLRDHADRIAKDLKEVQSSLTRNSDKTRYAKLMIEIRKFKDEVL